MSYDLAKKPHNQIERDEHDIDGVSTKSVLNYGWDSDNTIKRRIAVDSSGRLSFSQLVPEEYDYIALTYVASGNGEGEIETVTYKNGGSGGSTAATLTLAYDANNNLSSVAKT